MKEKICNVCKMKGHLANMCRTGGSGSAAGGSDGGTSRASGSGGEAKLPAPSIRSKLNFAKGTKKEIVKEGAEGMVLEEVLSNSVGSDPLTDV